MLPPLSLEVAANSGFTPDLPTDQLSHSCLQALNHDRQEAVTDLSNTMDDLASREIETAPKVFVTATVSEIDTLQRSATNIGSERVAGSWWSLCGDFGDGDAGRAVVDDGLFGIERGDEGLQGEVVDRAG